MYKIASANLNRGRGRDTARKDYPIAKWAFRRIWLRRFDQWKLNPGRANPLSDKNIPIWLKEEITQFGIDKWNSYWSAETGLPKKYSSRSGRAMRRPRCKPIGKDTSTV